jgi:glycogen debranching enzyme
MPMTAAESAAGAEFPPASAAVEFYIPATSSLQERRPRTLKHGDTFGVFDHYGDIIPGDGSPEGLYHQDTRYLSGLQLLINDRRPMLLSSTVQDNNALLSADLTNPDFFDEQGRLTPPRDTIHIVRAKFIWEACVYERIALRNFDARAHPICLSLVLQADFADLFEVRGHRRERRGRTSAAVRDGQTITFIHHGLTGDLYRTTVHFAPAPTRLAPNRAVFDLVLQPYERISLFFAVDCDGVDPPRVHAERFFIGLRAARRALRTSTGRASSVATSNQIFNEMLRRSIADLYMLITDTAQGPYPYAGIPWFCTEFGRDGIITAMQMLWVDPTVARGVLKFLAATQATEVNAEADAEPGKILHETRQGEMARLGEVPFGMYYGSVDATPLFVMLAGMYYERTGDIDTIRALWPNLRAALRWIDESGDLDRDGLVEYGAKTDRGLSNQGWKDSQDSVFHADGQLAEGPIALCEVQGYVFAAKRHAARLAVALGFGALADSLRGEAAELRDRFEAAFWCADIGTYALALDGGKSPCRVRSSNAGQVLLSGIPTARRAARVAGGLMDNDFFSGWGIRTIAEGEARYNPMSYHNGSIWPHDNALIALGLARYALGDHIVRMFHAVFEAASYMDLRRLPELFCGFRRVPGKGPTSYPVACSPQAWASATPFAFLQACLGLSFDPAGERVRFRQPRLPEFLDEVVIRQLRVGDSEFDLMLRRYGADVSVNVLDRRGDGRVAITV